MTVQEMARFWRLRTNTSAARFCQSRGLLSRKEHGSTNLAIRAHVKGTGLQGELVTKTLVCKCIPSVLLHRRTVIARSQDLKCSLNFI